MERWATFDCYGTLIDWNAGIGRELERLFGAAQAGRLLHAYHELEPQIQHEEPGRSYRDVLAMTLARLAEREDLPLAADEHGALARSLPSWEPFPEVRESLEDAGARGWKLAVLSNTDRDFVDASLAQIGVPFELAIVASEIGSYKPAHRHWEVFFERTDADRAGHVHVAASLFHDALDEAFHDHWEHHSIPFEEWWEQKRAAPDYDPTIWFLVRDGDEVAAVVRNDPDRSGGGLVGALGVRRPWRGKGLGRALLLRTFGEFHRRGIQRVALGVDAQNPTGATKLYESVGMQVELEAIVFEKRPS